MKAASILHRDHRSAPDGTRSTPRSGTCARWCAARAALVLTGLVVTGAVWADPVYKWRSGGSVTYQDRAPDSRQDDGHSVLNTQGVVLERVLSREERRSARKLAREQELSRIRDRALLATFTTEEDLTRTRDDRIGMIDGLISRLDDRIRILSERLSIVNKRVQIQEKSAGAGGAQQSLHDELQSLQRNIENAWSLIDSKASERSDVADKFENDLSRYRELKAARR